ncbi:chloramphenicol phosphotransferase [Streptomyces sp. CBMA291]|nr:chloramphenicol phosphotransferase [Streptomyces sp. CBMA291]MBD0716723.1 chloramphenicol phosphotransferase [Streptomyces sp. CBMA370]
MIILNGASSSGKSGIARCLQTVLPEPWLTFGIDSLIDAMPASMQSADDGIGLGDDGGVHIGDTFRRLEAAWAEGLVTMARAGARIIVDDVFLGAATAQERWRTHLGDLDVLWAGVHCDPAVATSRETARGDRIPGMAARQAHLVHQGVRYDIEVDTTRTEALDCARAIAARVR